MSSMKYNTESGVGKMILPNLDKVQEKWKHLINNYARRFLPRGFVKVNSSIPLTNDWCEAMRNPDQFIQSDGEELPHPYEKDIKSLPYRELSQELLWEITTPKLPKKKSYRFISTLDDLKTCIDELSQTNLVAIDLEHHSHNSYKGFTCLIQISSRSQDYLIDPFPLFEHLHILNEITTNKNILKVFHGSDSDVIWLQRDFGVYLVHMIDTFQAAKAMRLPISKSYASLVQFYLGKTLDKAHQRSDWRMRPLPDSMLEYARSDTFHLLSLFDCMKNHILLLSTSNNTPDIIHSLKIQAIEGTGSPTSFGIDLLERILQDSSSVALMTYKEPVSDKYKRLDRFLLQKDVFLECPLNCSVLGELLEWRDQQGRIQDVSVHYLLADALILQLAKSLPRTPKELVKVNSGTGIAYHHNALLSTIEKGMEASMVESFVNRNDGGNKRRREEDVESPSAKRSPVGEGREKNVKEERDAESSQSTNVLVKEEETKSTSVSESFDHAMEDEDDACYFERLEVIKKKHSLKFSFGSHALWL